MEQMPMKSHTTVAPRAQDLEIMVPSLPWAGGCPGCLSLCCLRGTAGSRPVAHGASEECRPCRAYGTRAGNRVKPGEAKLIWDRKRTWAFN